MTTLVQQGQQMREEVDALLARQVDALIRRVAAKDAEFAQERRVLKQKVTNLERDVSRLKRELRVAKGQQ